MPSHFDSFGPLNDLYRFDHMESSFHRAFAYSRLSLLLNRTDPFCLVIFNVRPETDFLPVFI
jgi:hypothetical protein